MLSKRLTAALVLVAITISAISIATAPVAMADSASPHKSYFVKLRVPGQAAVKLYAREYGRGRVMLLLHGFGASGYMWRKLVPSLSRHYRVITLDLKGFGRSSKPDDNHYSVLDQAALVKAFIRRRRLHNIILVGHSFGGSVALALTLNMNVTHRSRISRLILMDAPSFPQKLSPTFKFLRQPGAELLLTLTPAEIYAKMGLHSNKLGWSHITFKDIRAYAAPLRTPGGVNALIQTAKQIIPKNLPALVRKYPTVYQRSLLIWCRDDPTTPLASGRKLHRALPNSRLRIIKSCDHVPPEEMPRTTLRMMKAFLRH